MKVNCGSGQRRFDNAHGWINADCVSRPPDQVPDVLMNALEPWPWDDGSAEMVVMHHVLEHFGCGESTPAIQEAWRVLQPGGSLLVFVPDMRALAQRWLTRQLSDQVYLTSVYGAYQGEEGDRHKWGFTRESLWGYATAAIEPRHSWDRVKPFDWREIPGADIARDFWILGMEAVK